MNWEEFRINVLAINIVFWSISGFLYQIQGDTDRFFQRIFLAVLCYCFYTVAQSIKRGKNE